MSTKRPPSEWTKEDLHLFEPGDQYSIQQMASGLSEQEVCDYWGYDYSELEDNDKFFFDINFKRGRIEAKNRAVQKLFTAMSDRNGYNPALEYLTRFADKWPDEKAGGAVNRTFKIMMD